MYLVRLLGPVLTLARVASGVSALASGLPAPDTAKRGRLNAPRF